MLRWAPWSTGLWGVLILVDAVFTALTLWATRGTVNAVVAAVRAGAPLAAAAPWLLLIAGVQAGVRLAALLRPYVRERVRVRAGAGIQAEVLARACRLPAEAFDDEATHDVIRRVGEGADSRGPDLVAEALGLAQRVPSVVVNAVFLGEIAPWLPFAAGALEGIFIWQMIAQGQRERAFAVDWTRQRRLTGYYASLLTSRQPAAEIRLFGLAGELVRRWARGVREHASAKHRMEARETLQFLPSSAVGAAFLVGAVAAVTALHGPIEPGLAALFLTALFGVMAGMNAVQQSMRQFVGHAGYAADLRRLLEGIPDEAGPPAAVPATFPQALAEGFRLRGIRYRYPGAAEDALRGIDADLPAGRITAIVGANGAGKSTLASLVLGLRRPSEGSIAVDGVDLAGIPAAEVRRACAAVFQQPVRYPGTLRQNVALGESHPLSADLGTALEFAGLADLAGGPEQMLSPEFGGTDLSGGEWQRIAIARGLFRPEARVLVLDEPSAALDPLSELALFERFAALAAGRTAVLISHRLGPTRLADHVIVLERGLVVEQGPPGALLAAGGPYADMFAAQAEWYR